MIRGGVATLPVKDVPAAVRFYVETLGMKLVLESGPEDAVIDAGDGFEIRLRKGTVGAPQEVGFYTKLALAEAVAIYENRGVAFERKGDRATFRDPDGHVLYLTESRRTG